MNFLFYLFLIGLLIASWMDLKRREVDNWLNLFLLFSGGVFIVFNAFFYNTFLIIIFGVFSFFIMFLIEEILYHSRVFGGGDSKLMLAMFSLFVGAGFFATLFNIFSFVILLFLCGGVGGLVYSFVLFFINFKKVSKQLKEGFKSPYIRYLIFAGIVLFVLSYVDWFFLFVSIFVLIGLFLFVFARALDNSVMIKEVSPGNLREGDLLAEDVNFKGRKIKVDWEGLSKKDILFLKGLRKKIKIKQGIPFAVVFLIAFLLWYFYRSWLLGLLFIS
jgi:Flp pilus assembly protein protease CpaA